MILLGLLLSGCATAECAGLLMPPKELAGPPRTPFKEAWIPPDLIGDYCFVQGTPERDRLACSRSVPALILLPEIDGKGTTRVLQSCLRDHEFGHLNDPDHRIDHRGWPMS